MAEEVSVSLGDIGVIKAVEFHFAVGASEPKTAKFLMRLDSKTPSLHKALVNNQMFNLAVATFRRPKIDGTAGREIYFRLRLIQARIAAIRQWSPDSSNPAESRVPEMQWVELAYLQAIPDYEEPTAFVRDEWR